MHTFDQQRSGVATGVEGQRSDILGLVKYTLSGFTGSGNGIERYSFVKDGATGFGTVADNDGLLMHIPGYLGHSYILQNQASITSEADISGYLAANKLVHGLSTPLGGTNLHYLAFGTKLYRSTDATSNSAMLFADTFTNNVRSMAVGKVAGSLRLIVGTDGDTDDVKCTTDPTALPPTWATFVALSAGDYVDGITWLPNQGPKGIIVLKGKIGGVSGLWSVACDAAIPATPMAIVDYTTRDVPDSSATTTTLGPYYPRQVIDVKTGGAGQLTNATNVLLSDGNYTTIAQTGTTAASFVVSDFNELYTVVPSGIIVTGMTLAALAKESDATSNAYFSSVQLVSDSVVDVGNTVTSGTIGWPKINGLSGNEFGTSDTAVQFGGSADNWGANLTASLVRRGDFGVWVHLTYANVIQTVSIDYVALYISYQLTGTQIPMAMGGFTTGALAANPSRIAYIVPFTDELTATTYPRMLIFVDCIYDATGSRMTGTVSTPPTLLNNVIAGCSYGGGYAVADAKIVKLIDGSGGITDLRIPTTFAGVPWRVVKMEPRGRFLMVTVCTDANTDSQVWIYFDGAWFAYSPKLSKASVTLAARPLQWAASSISSALNRVYVVYPATTHTAVYRNFVPENMLDDPLTANTTEVKQDGPLSLRTPDVALFGPTESNKVFHGMAYGGRQLSATSGTYGTAEYFLETGGDTTFASPAFDSGQLNSAFAEANAATSGKAVKSGMLKITMRNAGSSSTKTANALPITLTGSIKQKQLRAWTLTVDEEALIGAHDSWDAFVDLVVALQNTQLSQRFRIGGRTDVPAILEFGDTMQEPGRVGTTSQPGGHHVITILEKPGSIS